MTDKIRRKIRDKFGGKCAFCGDDLNKGWHVWDIQPIRTVVTADGELGKINEEENNLMPACKECGSVRIKKESGKMSIEAFRTEIVRMYQFARNYAMYSSSIRRAIRFGLIVETGNDLKFYFETVVTPPLLPKRQEQKLDLNCDLGAGACREI